MEKVKKVNGRPKKVINPDDFIRLCKLQCTKDEFCAYFEIDEKTLTRWCKDTYNMGFSDIFAIKRKLGFISFRRMRFNMAKKSDRMAIYLSGVFFPDELVKKEEAENQSKVVKVEFI